MKRKINPVARKWSFVVGLLLVSLVSIHAAPKKLLVVTITKGFRHSSIPTAERILAEIGNKSGVFTVDYARVEPNDPQFKGENGQRDDAKVNAAIQEVLNKKMSSQALAQYDGVIFANTTGMLPLPDPDAFIKWVHSGKAFIGMHSATDTFKDFDAFVDMIGGHFRSHGPQLEVDLINEDETHPATRHFRSRFKMYDEIYLFERFHREKVHGLLTLDQCPHKGWKNSGHPGDYPVAWCKQYGQGKMFYTSLGHREDVWENPEYQQHVLGGIKWALGLEPGGHAPQSGPYQVSAEEKAQGFKPLFNGVNLDGWRLRHAGSRASWSAQNNMLVNETAEEKGSDLVTNEAFWNFTIRYEYLVPEGSNSGLYLRGRHEIQILEDFKTLALRQGGNGGLYNLSAPDYFVSLPAGRWQSGEATVMGDEVTVILNGVKIHDRVKLSRATGGELDSNLDQPGPIMLQGDHGAVAFRNMRIKPL